MYVNIVFCVAGYKYAWPSTFLATGIPWRFPSSRGGLDSCLVCVAGNWHKGGGGQGWCNVRAQFVRERHNGFSERSIVWNLTIFQADWENWSGNFMTIFPAHVCSFHLWMECTAQTPLTPAWLADTQCAHNPLGKQIHNIIRRTL